MVARYLLLRQEAKAGTVLYQQSAELLPLILEVVGVVVLLLAALAVLVAVQMALQTTQAGLLERQIPEAAQAAVAMKRPR